MQTKKHKKGRERLHKRFYG